MKKIRFFVVNIKFLIVMAVIIFAAFAALYLFDDSVAGETGLRPEEEAYLAIIIDDFGDTREGVKEMMEINRHITFAVIPFLRYSEYDAKKAWEKGYEIVVHLPMEPLRGKISWLGPRPILSGMNPEHVRKIVEESFLSVPYAVGANIHMGSKASGDSNVMSAILDVVKENSFYFVDSRTSRNSAAGRLAKEKGVVCLERHIFLDEQRSVHQIKDQIKKAGDIAVKKGYAIAVGHVGVEGGRSMAHALKDMLPRLDEKNIKLVFISELIKILKSRQ